MISNGPSESGVADRVIVVVALALAAAYVYATGQLRVFAFGDPVGPRAFPQLLAAGLLVGAVMLALEIRGVRAAAPAAGAAPRGRRTPAVVGGTIAVTAAYLVAFQPLGYALATSLYLFVMTSYFHRGRWRTNALTSVGFGVAGYLVFTKALGASLPSGILPF